MKRVIFSIFALGVLALVMAGCRGVSDKLEGDEPLNKDFSAVLFTISRRNNACIPVDLAVYNDGTYELFTAYKACRPNKFCTLELVYTKSIKGKYDYDVMKIIENSTDSSDKAYSNEDLPEYEIYMGNTYVEQGYEYQYTVEKGQTNKYLEEFLKEIDVDLRLCAKAEYVD